MNLRTEEEAKKTWCPMATVITRAGGAGNRYYQGDWGGSAGTGDIERESCCVASGCMMWRFKSEKVPLREDQITPGNTAVGLRAALQPNREPRRGFCGLAGQA